MNQGRRNFAFAILKIPGSVCKTAVLISDYRETNDILSHRDAVDFKRGKKVEDFSGILPHAHPAMEAIGCRFRGSRDLVQDLMTPLFLNKINAPVSRKLAALVVDEESP
ncbi:hypothetical protein PspLS_10276 [Pyricularia sp. CBS 133598]|nr:hypothetical protein PspLS_10276 [Pyricularia sp. CBS 133598]